MNKKDLAFSTRAIHTSTQASRVPSTPIAVPIFQTASFAFDEADQIVDAIADHGSSFVYSRLSNPTVDALERGVADLERAEAALAFASGMAAIHGVLTWCCKSGDHIVAPASMYGGSFELMQNVLPRYGIETTFVPYDNLEKVRDAIRDNTKVVYGETIGNPNLTVFDLSAIAEVAHGAGASFVVDNTFASPFLCRPIEHGADYVVHSASKYLGGHGDLIAGLVVGKKNALAAMQHVSVEVGASMAPFVAWLILRGLKTLAVRMRQHTSSATTIAEALEASPHVERVHYPGLASHPHHETAKRQLDGFGGMIAFELLGDLARATRFVNGLELVARAGSLGDTHSLVLQPAATSHRQLSPEARKKAGISDGFIRFSVGLEAPEDLIADITRALEQA